MLESLHNQVVQILGGVYPDRGATFDGTPNIGEVEAIIVTTVTKDWEIIQLLVKAGIYKKKLSGEELASHVIDVMKNCTGRALKYWVATHQDHVSTNKAALKVIEDTESIARPTNFW